jgi:hypothetical protein
MVALARAVIRDRRMILADELSFGLAPVVIDEIFDVLERLKHDGISVMLVEQYAERALALADTAYVLSRGRMVFCGEAHELQDSPELVALYLGEGTAPEESGLEPSPAFPHAAGSSRMAPAPAAGGGRGQHRRRRTPLAAAPPSSDIENIPRNGKAPRRSPSIAAHPLTEELSP